MQVDEQPAREEDKQGGGTLKRSKEGKPENDKEPVSIQNFSRVLPEQLAHLKKGANGTAVYELVYKNGGTRRALGVTVVHKNNDANSFIQLNDSADGNGKGKDTEVMATASTKSVRGDMDMVD